MTIYIFICSLVIFVTSSIIIFEILTYIEDKPSRIQKEFLKKYIDENIDKVDLVVDYMSSLSKSYKFKDLSINVYSFNRCFYYYKNIKIYIFDDEILKYLINKFIEKEIKCLQ